MEETQKRLHPNKNSANIGKANVINLCQVPVKLHVDHDNDYMEGKFHFSINIPA